jgi:hypothetical protein
VDRDLTDIPPLSQGGIADAVECAHGHGKELTLPVDQTLAM